MGSKLEQAIYLPVDIAFTDREKFFKARRKICIPNKGTRPKQSIAVGPHCRERYHRAHIAGMNTINNEYW